ncbi:MAG: PorT family protein, partial [Chitinophagaceae bacterium]|nr:PorT family protein [Chitinophagaceae bacterium]
MKKLLTALTLLCIATLSQAQMRMAILGGPLSASVKETNSLPDWQTNIKPGYSSRSGLHLGVLLEIPLSNRFYFQPGLLYMAKGRKYYMNNDTATSIITDTISSSSTLSVNYIEAPLNITYKVPLAKRVNLLLSAGPYVGFFYNGARKYETRLYSSNSFKNDDQKLETGKEAGKVKTVDIGFNARAGFEIGNLLLTGFMSQGITNFYHASYDGTFKHKVIGASIGFWLNKLVKTEKPRVVTLPVKTEIKPVFKDTDGDGITDEADRCPMQAGPPEFNGCPIPDSDGDGLIDTEDKCPTEAGLKSNNGCPAGLQDTAINEVEKKVNFAAKKIFFNAGSDQLTINSTEPLD